MHRIHHNHSRNSRWNSHWNNWNWNWNWNWNPIANVASAAIGIAILFRKLVALRVVGFGFGFGFASGVVWWWWLLVVVLLVMVGPSDAWIQCSEKDGGGICPDYATCCPTGTPGVSSCVSGNQKNPPGALGECCDPEGTTGCTWGYGCALIRGHFNHPAKEEEEPKQEPKQEEEEGCVLRNPHPLNPTTNETYRYRLCKLPSSLETLELQAFPIDGKNKNKYNATYYSSMGSILPPWDCNVQNQCENQCENAWHRYRQKFSSIETVLVIVHGSGRNADDYLCAGISMMDEALSGNNGNGNGNKHYNDNSGKVLVIAPRFNADTDHKYRQRHPNTLYWLEKGVDVPLGHTWRYGADAANTVDKNGEFDNDGDHPMASSSSSSSGSSDTAGGGGESSGISSYAVMDRLLEFLIDSKQQETPTPKDYREGSVRKRSPPSPPSLGQHPETAEGVPSSSSSPSSSDWNFPNLQRIVVAGHSAGGQYVHRWALLSSSNTIWGEGEGEGESESESESDDKGKGKGDDKDKESNGTQRSVEVRAVVANPRSYCYLDNRRMIRTNGNGNGNGTAKKGNNYNYNEYKYKYKYKYKYDYNTYDYEYDYEYEYAFAVPDPSDIATCPTYDQWQWGLQPGGDVIAPYKDASLSLLGNNTKALALRYSGRRVFYLAGENDTEVFRDRCETYGFQGDTRNERAGRYFAALTEYFGSSDSGRKSNKNNKNKNKNIKSVAVASETTPLVHKFSIVPKSPHDHTLMFQSVPGKEAFFGTTTNTNTNTFDYQKNNNSKDDDKNPHDGDEEEEENNTDDREIEVRID